MSGSTMHHLTLPEVAPTDSAMMELASAGFWIRMAAVAVDWALAYVIAIIIATPISEFVGAWTHLSPPSLIEGLLFVAILYLLTFGLYFAWSESSRFQGTPGKLLFRLKVTDEAGRRITPARAWARFAAKQLTWFFVGVGYLLILWPPGRQSLHDRIAHTRVVRIVNMG